MTLWDHVAIFERWHDSLDDDVRDQLKVVWGKSKDKPAPVPLMQHLLDTLAVADLMWQRYLAPSFRAALDRVTEDDGRRFFRWICAIHDVGKCTPAFQRQVPELRAGIERAGLPIASDLTAAVAGAWRHDRTGAGALWAELTSTWSDRTQIDWVWPIIGGHHGQFYGRVPVHQAVKAASHPAHRKPYGDGPWEVLRSTILEGVAVAAGFAEVRDAEPAERPERGEQLALSGFVMMADWIASGDHFGPVGEPSLGAAIERAEEAWERLSLRGGWGQLAEPPEDLYLERFGWKPRPVQKVVIDTANAMPAPGMLLIEAPMGEGKTEAALAAAEVLAHRFGADGVLIGMPTQATADPMLDRVARWLDGVSPGAEIALVHGRSAFNEQWEEMRRRRQSVAQASAGPAAVPYEDPFGIDDELYSVQDICHEGDHDGDNAEESVASGRAVSEWFNGRHRPLLSPNVVTTIDQALFAATRIRTAAIRFSGLAGKVVVLDEVHAADEYMTQFFRELLGWLARCRVPVVLLSATLAGRQREALIEAYRAGAVNEPTRPVVEAKPLPSYPSVTAVWGGNEPRRITRGAPISGKEHGVAVEFTVGVTDEDLIERLSDELTPEGGCVLVIRNTVDRAQTFARLAQEQFGDDVVLLHSRLTVRRRAEVTARLVGELGPVDPGVKRPHRRVVVATQVAEQSFDVDADLLVSDLAPVDLVFQRIGRLHRHERSGRPERFEQPMVILTGIDAVGDRPEFERGSELIYGRHRLLRSLAILDRETVSIPGDIATLTEVAYGPEPELPDRWSADEAESRREWDEKIAFDVGTTLGQLLSAEGSSTATTLADLSGSTGSVRGLERFIGVRSGDIGEEVLLIQRARGRLRTLDGIDLGINGEVVSDAGDVRWLLGDSIQLPAFAQDLNEAARDLPTLPEWRDHSWLRWTRVLILDEDGQAELGGRILRYDRAVGLTLEGRR